MCFEEIPVIRRLLLSCCLVAGLAACGGEPSESEPASSDSVEDTAVVEAPEATEAPAATEVPTEIPTAEPTPEPIHIEGTGQTATDPVVVGFPVAVVSFTHSGQRNFIVQGFESGGAEDYLANAIGNYSGEVLLSSSGTWTFDVNADGAWTIDVSPPGLADGPAFSGAGDQVSGVFDPPASGAWEFSHDGQRNFIVQTVCAGGTGFVQNEIGPVTGSSIVKFDDGPCLWTVKADGNWSIAPR